MNRLDFFKKTFQGVCATFAGFNFLKHCDRVEASTETQVQTQVLPEMSLSRIDKRIVCVSNVPDPNMMSFAVNNDDIIVVSGCYSERTFQSVTITDVLKDNKLLKTNICGDKYYLCFQNQVFKGKYD